MTSFNWTVFHEVTASTEQFKKLTNIQYLIKDVCLNRNIKKYLFIKFKIGK